MYIRVIHFSFGQPKNKFLCVHFYNVGTSLFSKTMCQVVSYRRFKTIENSQTVSRKSGHGRLLEVVVYERFQYKALTENIFGVLVFASSSIVVTYIPCENTWKI